MTEPTRPIDKATTAVVLYDLLNISLKSGSAAHQRAIADSGLIPNLVRFVAAIRPFRIPIMWIRVNRRADRADMPTNVADVGGFAPMNEHESALIDEMTVAPEDQMILKPRRDPFIATDLDFQLRARRIDTILLGGYATNWGVESTARTAYDLGYNVVLLGDCCWNVEVELHRFALEKILPRFSRVMTSDEAIKLIR